MKIASTIFIILGIITDFWINPILGCIALIFGLLTLMSLVYKEKYIWMGVCSIIFVSVLGGIFYLCWDDENKEKK